MARTHMLFFTQIALSCRVPPGYVYQSPYLAATTPGSLMPLPATQLTHAAAVAAATSQFYEYQNAAAVAAAAAVPYAGQYSSGFDAYSPYTGTAGKFSSSSKEDFIVPWPYQDTQCELL